VAQRWRTSQVGAKLRKWPKEQMEAWGGAFMFTLFAGILVCEEAWDLQHSGVLSAALMGLITAGAVVTSLQFEKRMWCRYLCPIGAMNGLMAKVRWAVTTGAPLTHSHAAGQALNVLPAGACAARSWHLPACCGPSALTL
jgi:hypothetical protein